ncbi:MAG TPA: type II toxin-antitoxin system VapB family antitoxin [Caulobacteraceae bacterium]|nr:type II toxin-antitoxin system VapB family antitoxin [Caulobacteraceae bacterium]
MNGPPIQIRNDEVVREIRELADLTHKPITEAVSTAVKAELARVRRRSEKEKAEQRAAVREIVERFKALPKVGPMLTDEDLYDEDGLPR